MTNSGIPVLVCLALAALPAAADDPFTQHGAHVHGQAGLMIAVDGDQLTLELTLPAHDAVGFERPPASEAERGEDARVLAALEDPARLFRLPPGAECRLVDAAVGSPWTEDAPASGADGHADYSARWSYQCGAPARLQVIEVQFSSVIRPGTQVEAIVLTESGQRVVRLGGAGGRIELR